MPEERLLERIHNTESRPKHFAGRNLQLEVSSIINHLQRLLNSRQGSVPIAADYGIPDITNFPGDDLTAMAKEMEKSLRQVIEKFEPRLRDVRISFLPAEDVVLALRFKIEAFLVDEADNISVAFETEVSPEGKIQVSE